MPRATHKTFFNIAFTPLEYKQLKELADHKNVSMGAIARAAIHAHFLMDLQHQPCCANGTRCYVPQMHPPVAGAPPTAPVIQP